jgi:hypothetical protein
MLGASDETKRNAKTNQTQINNLQRGNDRSRPHRPYLQVPYDKSQEQLTDEVESPEWSSLHTHWGDAEKWGIERTRTAGALNGTFSKK